MEMEKDVKELSDKFEEVMGRLGDIPIMDYKVYTSKDGKYIINEVSMKMIKHRNYYDAITQNLKDKYDKEQRR
jgi:hypothetical protein